MRIAIQTLGTRGDVQPYLGLASGLAQRGHTVQIAAPSQFEAMVGARGIPFVGLPSEFLALIDSPEGKAAIAGGRGFSAGFKLLKHVRPLMRALLEAEWAAVQSFAPDLIVHHPKSIATPHMAEAIGRPFLLAAPLPGFTPTAAFPSPILPFASLGPLNRLSHVLAIRGGDLLFRKEIAAWREEVLGLGRRRTRRAPSSATIYAYSRHVVPVPADYGPEVLVSGYWFLDEPDWRPDAGLEAFLASGGLPVYVGFGSMPGLDGEELAGIVVDALARAGKRGILAVGGGALRLAAPPAHVHILASAPHDQLFPRVAATVHHGGAGTTGASLRAGKPTVICPFFGDQPFWARRVTELGAGPVAPARNALTVENLTAAIVATDDAEMRRRAAALGEAIRREDGVSAAIDFIERRAATVGIA